MEGGWTTPPPYLHDNLLFLKKKHPFTNVQIAKGILFCYFMEYTFLPSTKKLKCIMYELFKTGFKICCSFARLNLRVNIGLFRAERGKENCNVNI